MIRDLTLNDKFRGMILGTAVGDALGLPAEGLSRQRAHKFFSKQWQHRFLINRGMISDDTEHTVFVAQSLLVHPNSPEYFAKRLSWCLRWWLLSLPAGVGFATLKAIIRLWIGFSPDRSGVYSAGNGPAMRSAPIGAFFAFSDKWMDTYLNISTRMTHTDPKALIGAKAVAYLAAWMVREKRVNDPTLEDIVDILKLAGTDDKEWGAILNKIITACEQDLSVEKFAESLGLVKGVTGYIYHTVPVAVYAWLKHYGDFEKTIESVLNCGGDTDTSGAIAGALAGASVGERGIPEKWINGIFEWPRGIKFLRRLADRLSECSQHLKENKPIRYFWPGLVFRNGVFLVLVLLHGLRRLAPPY